MSEHIIAIIAGIIIGIVLAIIGMFFTADKNEQKNTGYGYSSSKSHGRNKTDKKSETILEMQQELKRLQEEIDAVKVNRQIKLKKVRSGTSTVSSGYDYKSACSELDIHDYDLLDEWKTRSLNQLGHCKEAAILDQKLCTIDRRLEADNKQEIMEALEELKDLCYDNPENVDLLYRIGKAHVKLCEDQPVHVVDSHIEKGIAALSTALELSDKHAEVHKWYGMCLGLRAQSQPLQQKASDGLLFKKHCELACALNPNDAVLHFLLGMFDFEMAGLGWFERTAARCLLGDSVDATYNDALKKFMKAEELSKRQHLSVKEKAENKKMIGNTLVAMGKKQEAQQWFRNAKLLELNVSTLGNK